MIGLSAELEQRFNALDNITSPQFLWLIGRGVPPRAVIYPEMPMRADVVFHVDARFFDFAEEADREAATTGALILLARDQMGEPVDLVAWSPRTHRVATWAGSDLPLLGWENALTVRPDLGDTLSVHPSPLEWLKDNREGVVILKPERARWYLEGFSLKVADIEFGQQIRETLQWPAPRIFVEAVRRAAA